MQFLDGIEEAQSVPPTEPASSSRIGTSVVKGKEKAEDIDTDSEEGGAQLVRAKAQLEFAKSDEIREEKQTNEAAKGRMSIDDRRQKMAELRKKIVSRTSDNRAITHTQSTDSDMQCFSRPKMLPFFSSYCSQTQPLQIAKICFWINEQGSRAITRTPQTLES